MKKKFVNRKEELRRLGSGDAALTVLYGRRRVGKTSLVEQWGKGRNFAYTQAIEGAVPLQLEQLTSDLAPILPTGVFPRSYDELLSLLALRTEQTSVAIDEFPYLVKSNPSLPSLLQRWVDHEQPETVKLILLGSSQTMMHDIFLNEQAPLYERADVLMHVRPMSYRHFCQFTGLPALEMESFHKFSMVGGVPRYWHAVSPETDVLELAEHLFFSRTARLEGEPSRLLRDENISGLQARSILECIGRGSAKPSEIAQRMGIPQTAVSKPLGVLLNTSLVERELPFGESTRSTRKTLYSISDHALRFWYGVYSPHRSKWHLYSKSKKRLLIGQHAAGVLESAYRGLFPDGARFWAKNEPEYDCVRYSDETLKGVIITEIKMGALTNAQKRKLRSAGELAYTSSKLSQKYRLDEVEIFEGEDVLRRLNNEKG